MEKNNKRELKSKKEEEEAATDGRRACRAKAWSVEATKRKHGNKTRTTATRRDDQGVKSGPLIRGATFLSQQCSRSGANFKKKKIERQKKN